MVKLIDRAEEILVDTSELLRLDNQLASIPAFAQLFRLHGFDETQNTSNTTRKLKKSLLNQILLGHELSSPPRTLTPPIRANSIVEPPPSRFSTTSSGILGQGFGSRILHSSFDELISFGSCRGFTTSSSSSRATLSTHRPSRGTVFTFVSSHLEDINDSIIQDVSPEDELSALNNELPKHSFEALDLPCLGKNIDQCCYRATTFSVGQSRTKDSFRRFRRHVR